MAILSRIVTLSTTPQLVATQRGYVIEDVGAVFLSEPSADIFIGGIGVTAAAGTRVAVGTTMNVDIGPGDDVWAVASAGTPTVRVLTTRNAQP